MPVINVLEVFDQSLIESGGGFLVRGGVGGTHDSSPDHDRCRNRRRTDSDIVKAAAYAAAHAFIAGRTYALLNDALDTFPVLMSREELQDYHEFLRGRNNQ
jgi:hypothetical protein